VKKIQVFCDFDGTITTRDTVDVLLSNLACPEWEEIEDLWERGLIGSRECMARQIPLIRGGWKAVREVLDGIELTPGVSEFVDWCRSNFIPVVVVSDGLDRVIEYLLKKNGIYADRVFSNHLIEASNGAFSLQSSPRPRFSGCQSGVCKCQIAGQQAYETIKVIIGDGRSDFCWSKEANVLFAKGKLIDYCSSKRIAHNPFETFFELRKALSAVNNGKLSSVVFNKPIAAFVPGNNMLHATR
jgi:2-hydroxy-3-keto-5-methylthiopentenyl-1-phosphate phosphatase